MLALLVVLCACGSVNRIGAQHAASESDLRYRLVDKLGAPAYCDPAVYPVARLEDPAAVARSVAALRSQRPTEFDAIVRHEHLDLRTLSLDDNERILSQAAALAAISLTPDGSQYHFDYESLGPPPTRVMGTIAPQGPITVTTRTPAPHRMCPV